MRLKHLTSETGLFEENRGRRRARGRVSTSDFGLNRGRVRHTLKAETPKL
jgi:hypothetical protein